jgi:dipeptidyl aminopeptidase/acylaminoacyl peptidase
LIRAIALVGLALLVLGAGCQGAAAPLPAGKIAWPKDGDLWSMSLPDKTQKKLTNLPRSAAVTGATWSPDGAQVIYAQFWRRPNENASGADLMIMDADGANSRSFMDRSAPSAVLETPQWQASGQVYYTERVVQGAREQERILRAGAAGGPPEPVVANGFYPAVSPDGSTIVFARSTQTGTELRKKSLAEPDTSDGCVLVPDTVFQALSLPRISPDGKRLAFGGSGDPTGQPGACGSPPSAAGDTAPLALRLAEWFGVLPTPAYAHGLPYDIWSMSLDGGPLTKLADVKEDEPTVAWSPDGTHLAIFGVAALYVADANGGGAVQKLVDQGGYGALDWGR